MAYDEQRGVVVLFGGYNGSVLGDAWEWDGSTWSLITDGKPSPRRYHAMVYDAAREACMIYGGTDGSLLGDNWLYRCALLNLTVEATCPDGGPTRISWEGATPNGHAALIYARNTGSLIIPSRFLCAGTQLGLGPNQIQVAWQGRSNAAGGRVINTTAPPGVCGGYLQLIDTDTCETSNVEMVE
jgi:hypothetical protein